MKKSLSFLIETTFGKIPALSQIDQKTSDQELLNKVKKIEDIEQKELFLHDFLENSSDVYVLSTIYYIELIKTKNPTYAYDLALLLCRKLVINPRPYLLISKIAMEQNALDVAKSALEVAQWLSFGQHKDAIHETNKFFKELKEKEKKSYSDSSLWKEKNIDKLWVLIVLFYSLKTNQLFEYSIRLLDLFPSEQENYYKVQEIFGMTQDTNVLERFNEYIKNSRNLDNKDKSELLGINSFLLFKYDDSKAYLKKSDSDNSKFYLSLTHLTQGNTQEFHDLFTHLISRHNHSEAATKEFLRFSTPAFLSVFFIWAAISSTKIKLDKPENEKEICIEFTKIITRLLTAKKGHIVDELINKFEDLGFFSTLPSLFLYLSEAYTKQRDLEKAKMLLSKTDVGETHRIYAWIYRLEQKDELAEQELAKYREKSITQENKSVIYKMLDLNCLPISPQNEAEALKQLNQVYEQVAELKNQLALEYGINKDTCFEANCNECCKKTFPYISYIEYLYLRTWLEKQPESLKKEVNKKSKEILAQYELNYKKEPPFISGDNLDVTKDYPKNFTFDCPFLGDNGCNAFEAQPFMCRAYGYCSADKVQFQGCNYFRDQLMAATDMTKVRKVIDANSFTDFAKSVDKKLIETSVFAPIPVWFAQENSKETTWKAKYHMISKGLFRPIFNLITKAYKKRLKIKDS